MLVFSRIFRVVYSEDDLFKTILDFTLQREAPHKSRVGGRTNLAIGMRLRPGIRSLPVCVIMLYLKHVSELLVISPHGIVDR
jgi:hypothetical protein